MQQRVATPPAGSRNGSVPLAVIALAILLTVQSVIAAISAISDQSAFSEYLTQARRCVELNDCSSKGGRTGALPLFHGAAWIRLLAHSLRSGADQTAVQPIILAGWILAIPTTAFMLQRYLGWAAAALGIGLFFPVVLVGTDITMFTYTNLLPLPFALYYAGIALFTESRRTVFAAVASVALAAAVSVELGSIVMVPFHLLLVALTAPGPILAVAVAGLAFAIPFGWESTDAAREILRQVPTIRFGAALAIGGGVAVLGARLGRDLLQRTSSSAGDRVRTVMIAALIYATVAISLTCVLLMNGLPAPRYLLPAAFPFLYLVADRTRLLGTRPTVLLAALESAALFLLTFASHGLELLQVPVAAIVILYGFATLWRIIRRGADALQRSLWPALTVCICAMALSLADLAVAARRGPTQALTLGDAERVVSALYSAGYSYGDILGALQGPAADDLSPLPTERDPDVFRTAPPALANPGYSLLVVKVPDELVARTHGVVAALPAGRRRSALVVRSDRAYLDWTHMRRCGWSKDGGGEWAYVCAEPRTEQPLPRNWPYVAVADPAPSASGDRSDAAHDWSVRYEVPVRTAGRGVAHVIRTANEWPARWRIVAVQGVDFAGELPGPEIRLPDTRAATGIVELEFIPAVPSDLPWVWLPHVMEVTEENEHLLEPLRGAPSRDA